MPLWCAQLCLEVLCDSQFLENYFHFSRFSEQIMSLKQENAELKVNLAEANGEIHKLETLIERKNAFQKILLDRIARFRRKEQNIRKLYEKKISKTKNSAINRK